MVKVTYDKRFFDEMQDTNLSSARVIIPLVVNLVHPKSIVDIGCGRGLWLRACEEAGVTDYAGYDGEYVEKDDLVISQDVFSAVNLENPIQFPRKFDLTICLEVAEHLPASAADTLVQTLTQSAPVILFSAAPPFQGGAHHVNEQWPEYWEKKFRALGYIPIDALRRHVWNDTRVSFFYSQNILLYVKESELSKYPGLQKEVVVGYGTALPLIHPHMYLYYATRWRMVVPYLGRLSPRLLHWVKSILSRKHSVYD